MTTVNIRERRGALLRLGNTCVGCVLCVRTHCTCSGHKQCSCHKTKHLTMKNQTKHQRCVKFRVDVCILSFEIELP